MHRVGSKTSAEHGVVNTLAGCWRDHTRRVARYQHGAAIVPALHRLHGDRCAFLAFGGRLSEADVFSQRGHRGLGREIFVCAAHANAGVSPMGKDPGIKVWRQPTLIPDITAIRIIGIPVLILGDFDDFVIGQYPGGLFGIRDGGPGDTRACAVGTDHATRRHRLGAGVLVLGLIGEAHQIAFIAE